MMGYSESPPRARRSDPITSHEAGEAIERHMTRIQRNVLFWADRMGPAGFIDPELENNFQDFGSTHRTRRRELVDQGFIRDSGQTRLLPNHERRFIVWMITRRGSRAAQIQRGKS